MEAESLKALATDTNTTSIQGVPIESLIQVATRSDSCGQLAEALTAYMKGNTLPNTPCGQALLSGDLRQLTPAQQRITHRAGITRLATD